MTNDHRDEDVTRIAETLASTAGLGKVEAVDTAEAVGMAPADEPQRREPSLAELSARIKPIQDYIASFPRTGLKADKAFFDDLNGEP